MGGALPLILLVTIPFILGFVVIALCKRTTPHEVVDPAIESDRPDETTLEQLAQLERPEFERMIRRLLTTYGLEVATLTPVKGGGVEVVAYWPQELIGGKYLLHFARPMDREPVESRSVREFKEAVYEDRALKGIYVTTSFFSQEAREIADYYGVELVDGERLIYMLRERQPSFVTQLESFDEERHGGRSLQ